MCSVAAGTFINEVAANVALRQRLEHAVKIASERAAFETIAALGLAAGYDFTVEELIAGPMGQVDSSFALPMADAAA